MSKEEGNKLIAEFMGLSIYKDEPVMKVWLDEYDGTLFYCEWHPNLKVDETRLVAWQWQPDKNWCQLMPVVEKIEAIKNSDDYEVDIFGNCCEIGTMDENSAVGKTKIEATWKAIVQFIKWLPTKDKEKDI